MSYTNTELIKRFVAVSYPTRDGYVDQMLTFDSDDDIMFYNGAVNAHWLAELSPINLAGSLNKNLKDTAFAGLQRFQLTIFFVLIGICFLLPKDISFSVWFFYLFIKLQKLVAIWIGYGPVFSDCTVLQG